MEPDRLPSAFWAEMRWIVPALAVLLLMPPVLGLFDRPATVFGLPLLPVYMFAVWAAAIGLCAAMSRRALPHRQRPERPGP
ncbi:MAG: hypothetical protein RIB53_15640 [Roseitalea porphyridii]|jgi:hypothetical protein|nr:hypothetical protein [Roseitalea porphyridii]